MRISGWFVAAAAAATLWTSAGAAPARAASVLDQVKETGVLVAGTREHAIPFAFRDPEDHELKGFSVDLLEFIRDTLARELGRDVKLDLRVITSKDRIERVASGELQLVCGITTPTWDREASVDFTIPFFAQDTRVLTYRRAASRIDDLAGKKIGVVFDTTTESIVARAVPQATLVGFPDMEAGMVALEAGEIDGLSNIDTVLLGLLAKSKVRGQLVMVPRSGALALEPMACVVPENDSDWRDFVNRTIALSLDGITEYRGQYYRIYERWFGLEGKVPMPLSREDVRYYSNLSIWVK